jgi:hypothetical protein
MKPLIKAKIAFYTFFTAGYDIETQRRGAVVIVWFIGDSASLSLSSSSSSSSSSASSVKNIPMYAKLHSMTSIRASAIHMCTPDTLHFRDRRSIMTMRMCGHNRLRLKIHVGTYYNTTVVLFLTVLYLIRISLVLCHCFSLSSLTHTHTRSLYLPIYLSICLYVNSRGIRRVALSITRIRYRNGYVTVYING